MPYIKKKDRLKLNPVLNHANLVSNSGELNFIISELITAYFQNNGNNYQAINDIAGALEGAKLEFQRRVVVPYEDLKIEENGDTAGYRCLK